MSEIEIFVLDRKVKDVLFQCWSLFWQPCCPTIPGFNGPLRKKEELRKTFFLDPSHGQLLDHFIWWQTLKNIPLRSLRNYKRWVFLIRTHLSLTRLLKVYGSIFQMKLGSVNCVVVSSEKDLKEVLQTKGDHFDGRPDFRRFDLMFGGTRRNGIFCCCWIKHGK